MVHRPAGGPALCEVHGPRPTPACAPPPTAIYPFQTHRRWPRNCPLNAVWCLWEIDGWRGTSRRLAGERQRRFPSILETCRAASASSLHSTQTHCIPGLRPVGTSSTGRRAPVGCRRSGLARAGEPANRAPTGSQLQLAKPRAPGACYMCQSGPRPGHGVRRGRVTGFVRRRREWADRGVVPRSGA